MQLHTSINLRASPPACNSGTLTEARNHTIVVYNDFNLDGVLGDVMDENRQYADYANADTEWAAYQNAVSAGFALLQGNPDHSKMFANVNAPDGSENAYYTAVQNIEAAIAALDAKAVTDTAKLAALETVVNTYNNVDPDDYVLFTYDRFEDAYDRAANIVNSQVAPEGEEATFVAPAVAEFDIVYAKAQLELWGGRLLKKAPVKTHLQSVITEVEAISSVNYTNASWATLKTALTAAKEANTNATLQTVVNDARIALLNAKNDLVVESNVYLEAEVNTVVIDNGNAWVYGIEAESDDLSNFISAAGDYTVEYNLYNEDAYYYGTGSTATVSDANGVVQTFTIVLFGDVNGNGEINTDDADLITDYLNDDYVIPNGSAFFFAADVDGDGDIDINDYTIIDNGEVSQSAA